jgi:hypothetical protein
MLFMSKYPLEWGWHTDPTSNTPSSTEWKPKPTLIGGPNSSSASSDDGTKVAAYGDLRCQAICASGGDWGSTATHKIGRTNMCRKCAVKMLGMENSPADELMDTLKRFELERK